METTEVFGFTIDREINIFFCFIQDLKLLCCCFLMERKFCHKNYESKNKTKQVKIFFFFAHFKPKARVICTMYHQNVKTGT